MVKHSTIVNKCNSLMQSLSWVTDEMKSGNLIPSRYTSIGVSITSKSFANKEDLLRPPEYGFEVIVKYTEELEE